MAVTYLPSTCSCGNDWTFTIEFTDDEIFLSAECDNPKCSNPGYKTEITQEQCDEILEKKS